MKPENASCKGLQCGNLCEYMRLYQHPFFVIGAWCDYLKRDLCCQNGWFMASCKKDEPTEADQFKKPNSLYFKNLEF